MKAYLVLLFVAFFAGNLHAQCSCDYFYPFMVWAQDAIGTRDSIITGFSFGSTPETDVVYGEANLAGLAVSATTLRVVRRTDVFTVNEHGSWWLFGDSVRLVPYATASEQRIDFHPLQKNESFVVQVYSDNYPVQISAINPYSLSGISALLFDAQGQLVEGTKKELPANTLTPMYELEASQEGYFIVLNYVDLSNAVAHLSTPQWLKIWPNPAKQSIHIRCAKTLKTACISTLAGQKLLEIPDPGTQPVDISGLSAGCYVLHIETAGGSTAAALFQKQ